MFCAPSTALGRFQPAADLRLSICEVPPLVAAHSCAIQGPKGSADLKKDVKNEGCTSEFIENKGAKKDAPQSLLKTSKLAYFHEELLKRKDKVVGREVGKSAKWRVQPAPMSRRDFPKTWWS